MKIDHIDPGRNRYTEWKKEQAAQWMPQYHLARNQYQSGSKSPHFDGGAILKKWLEKAS